MTREELQQCIGYEVIVAERGGHDHGVLVAAEGLIAFVDLGDPLSPRPYGAQRVRCPALIARRFQEKQLGEKFPIMHDPPAGACTCGVVVSKCPVHCPEIAR